jgi:FkbM family methyltransferase
VKFYSGFHQINNIYDIGSHKGWWTREIQFVLPKANFFLFDPVRHEMMGINMDRVQVFNRLLSNKVGFTPFYSKGETGDSYRKEILKSYESDEIKDVKTITLNELFTSEKLPYPDLIKLDTQGSELDILE